MNIWYAWEIFVNSIVIFAEAYLLYKQLGIKKQKIPFMYLGIAIFIVAISIFNFINIQMTINITTGLTIYATRLIFTLLMILFTFLIFEGSVS